MLESLASLYRQLGGLGTVITLAIIVIFTGALYANIWIRRRYLCLSEELAVYCAGESDAFHSELLQWVTDEYKAALQSGVAEVNTLSIIDTGCMAYLKLCNLGEGFLKKANALLITTGLFGTFIGLTYSVGNIGSILANTSAEVFMSESGADTLSILVSSFQGMAVAFVTSLFGTGFSIANMIVTSLVDSRHAKKLFLTQLEEYLDIKVACEAKEKALEEQKQDPAKTGAEALTAAMSQFEKVICDFTTGLKDLKGFNRQLSGTLDQMQASFGLLCNSMDKTSESIYASGAHMVRCSDTLTSLTTEMAQATRHLEHFPPVLAQLQQRLSETIEDRESFLKAVHAIPDKLLNYQEAAAARADRKGGK